MKCPNCKIDLSVIVDKNKEKLITTFQLCKESDLNNKGAVFPYNRNYYVKVCSKCGFTTLVDLDVQNLGFK
jgi:hypothetical protein